MKKLFFFLPLILLQIAGLHGQVIVEELRNNEKRASFSNHETAEACKNILEKTAPREEDDIDTDDTDRSDDDIANTKAKLESNGSDLERVIQTYSREHLFELQQLIKKEHEEFQFQAASSHQRASLQAKASAEIFSKIAKEVQQSIGEEEEPLWIGNEEESIKNQVRAFREALRQVQPLLEDRKELYEKLSAAYAKKINSENGDHGARNILSYFTENTIDNHSLLIVGEHSDIRFLTKKEAAEQCLNDQLYKEGRILLEIAIMRYFGIDAWQRFRETFHADSIYSPALIAGEVKEFIDEENKRAETINPSSPKSYFFSSIDSLTCLQHLPRHDQDRIIRSNSHQLYFNPFSGEEPSFDHVTDPERTSLEGVIAVRASLREEDFFKNATRLNQRDILNRFDQQFLKEEKKIPLTIRACNRFVTEERKRSETWWNQFYYGVLSQRHKLNRELWSVGSGGVSAVKAQPIITNLGPFYSSVVGIFVAYGQQRVNDRTRPFRKEPEIIDDETVFAEMRKESETTDPNKGYYRDISESIKELEQNREKKMAAIPKEKLMPDFHLGSTVTSASINTPKRKEKQNELKKKCEDSINALCGARKNLALSMLERYSGKPNGYEEGVSSPQKFETKAKEFITAINSARSSRSDKRTVSPFSGATSRERSVSPKQVELFSNMGLKSSSNEQQTPPRTVDSNSSSSKNQSPTNVPTEEETAIQIKINEVFQFFRDQSSQVVANEREFLESIHKNLEAFSQQDLSQNRLCSSSEVRTMQQHFEEAKADFLLKQSLFHESDSEMEQLRKTAAKNAQFFFDHAQIFGRKVKGAERTAARIGGDFKTEINNQVKPLKNLKDMAQETAEAYDQLAKIYSLKMERISVKESIEKRTSEAATESGKSISALGAENAEKINSEEIEIQHGSLTNQLEALCQLTDLNDRRKIIVSHNGAIGLMEPEFAGPNLHTALKQNGIVLTKIALCNKYGLEDVQEFENCIQFKTKENKALLLGELQDILNSKFESHTPSYFLSLGHSVKDILHTQESYDERVIRSNGRNFTYNPFSAKEHSQQYLTGEKRTAEEGVEHLRTMLSELDFFKTASYLKQYHILKRFNKRFQGEKSEPLTIGAFKNFIKNEEAKNNKFLNKLYYTVCDPFAQSQAWAIFMATFSALRLQHPFSDFNVAGKFATTWAIDVGGETTGLYREYMDKETGRPDGGTYKKLVEEMLEGRVVSLNEPVSIPDFEKMFKEALEKRESQRKNLYEYVVACGEYEKSIQQILTDQKKWVSDLLKKRIEGLPKGDPKKETFSQMIDKIEADGEQLKQNVQQGIELLAKDSNPATAEAMKQLKDVQEALSRMISDSKSSYGLFSKKNLEELQARVRHQFEELQLEQARAQQSPEHLNRLNEVVMKNADFFWKRASLIEAKKKGGEDEIKSESSSSQGMMLSFLQKLEEQLKKTAKAYDQLVDVYSLKIMEQKSKMDQNSQGRESFLSRLKSTLPAQDYQRISLDDDGSLVVDESHYNASPSQEVRLLTNDTLPLLNLEIADILGPDAASRFISSMKTKVLASHPIIVGDILAFLELERREQKNSPAFYLSPGHSLEQLLELPSSEDTKLVRSNGSEFRHNPFSSKKTTKTYFTADDKTAREGVKVIWTELKKMEFYKKLTRLNQEWIKTHFEEKFVTRPKTWGQFFKSFLWKQEETQPDALTVKAVKEFIAQEMKESEEWKNYYQFRNNPVYASALWNIVTGLGVLARIDKRVINCTPIDVYAGFGAHSHLLFTMKFLTIFPPFWHFVPSLAIAYAANRLGESWLATRQIQPE